MSTRVRFEHREELTSWEDMLSDAIHSFNGGKAQAEWDGKQWKALHVKMQQISVGIFEAIRANSYVAAEDIHGEYASAKDCEPVDTDLQTKVTLMRAEVDDLGARVAELRGSAPAALRTAWAEHYAAIGETIAKPAAVPAKATPADVPFDRDAFERQTAMWSATVAKAERLLAAGTADAAKFSDLATAVRAFANQRQAPFESVMADETPVLRPLSGAENGAVQPAADKRQRSGRAAALRSIAKTGKTFAPY